MSELVDLGAGKFGLRFPYNAELVAKCKAVPGMKWDPVRRHWEGYSDALAQLGVTPPCVEGTYAYISENLRSYQNEGVEFLRRVGSKGVLLCDEMGLGKTAQALAAVELLGDKVVIVCPGYVRGVWARELAKWWARAQVYTFEGLSQVEVPADVDVVIVHYDIVYAHVGSVHRWGARSLILDEAHLLSNVKTRRSIACRTLAGFCTFRVGLTGTPMTNRPADMWNVVDTLSPGRFGSFFKFAIRFCEGHQESIGGGADAKVVWNFKGRSNLDELNARMKHFMLRRTHSDVALELPPRTRQVVELRVPKKYQVRVPSNTSSRVLQKALDAAADARLKEVLEMLRQHVEDGRRVVAFTHRREVAERVADECGGLAISGAYTQTQRDERIETCRSTEGPVLLAATIDSAGVGIDLTWADVVVFVELSYEPHKLLQAEARVCRFGQSKHVLVQYMVAQGCVDELIVSKVLSKLDSMHEALGDAVGGLGSDLRGTSEDDALSALWESL